MTPAEHDQLQEYVKAILMAETREDHVIPETLRLRLALMMRRMVEKAITVGWLSKDDVTLLDDHNQGGMGGILRAGFRGANDSL